MDIIVNPRNVRIDESMLDVLKSVHGCILREKNELPKHIPTLIEVRGMEIDDIPVPNFEPGLRFFNYEIDVLKKMRAPIFVLDDGYIAFSLMLGRKYDPKNRYVLKGNGKEVYVTATKTV